MVDNDWLQNMGSKSNFQTETHCDFAIQKKQESFGLDSQTQIHMNGSDSNEIFYSSIDDDLSNEEQWFRYSTPCRVKNINHFEDISSMFSEKYVKDLISDSVLSSVGIASPSIHKQEDYHTSNGEYHTRNDNFHKIANQPNNVRIRAEKRLRKPTQRYINEMPEPSSKFKPLVKRHKLLDVKSRDQKSLPEELAVKAIQVPFGPVVCCESRKKQVPVATKVKIESPRHLVSKPKLKSNQASSSSKLQISQAVGPGNKTPSSSKLKVDQSDGPGNQSSCSSKLKVDQADEPGNQSSPSSKLKIDQAGGPLHEQVLHSSSESLALVTTSRNDRIGVMKSEKSCGRRKHHIQWTISEVMKLIDGVSQHGVGRWSRIKKDLFASATHRTPVDLKDKWRNLLKATNMQREKKGGEDKKRNLAWRPLPKSVLQHVSELAIAHPYPRDLQSKQ